MYTTNRSVQPICSPALPLACSYAFVGLLTHEAFNLTLHSNETSRLWQTFSSVAMGFKWQQCCTDAILCCVNYHKKYYHLLKSEVDFGTNESTVTSSTTKQTSDQQQTCPPTWDGWLCWDEFAQPNQVLERSCPKHIYWHQLVPPCRGEFTCKSALLIE